MTEKEAWQAIADWIQLDTTRNKLGFKACMRDSGNKPRVVALDATDHAGRGIIVAQGKTWLNVHKVLVRKKVLKKIS